MVAAVGVVARESFKKGTGLHLCQIASKHCTSVPWQMLVGVIFTIHIMQRQKIFKWASVGEKGRKSERDWEKERESRLSGLDGDNFHIRDWEEAFLWSGANTKLSLWHRQTYNICFHLGLCVHVDGKIKEVRESKREKETLSEIKCHTYCEISLIKKWFGVFSGCTHGCEMDHETHPSQMALYTGQPLKSFILSRRKTVLLIHLLSALQCIWNLDQ